MLKHGKKPQKKVDKRDEERCGEEKVRWPMMKMNNCGRIKN